MEAFYGVPFAFMGILARRIWQLRRRPHSAAELPPPSRPGRPSAVNETAKRAALATLVVGGIVVLALALWQLRLLAALLFFAFILAAAMRPTVENLRRYGHARARPGSGCTTSRSLGLIAGLPLGDRAAGDRSDRRRARRPAEPGPTSAPQARRLDRDQARHPRRDPEAPRGPALRREPRRPRADGDADRVRGRARDLLRARERGLLDLRARPGRGSDLLAPPAAAPEEGPRHVGADRREAGRVHPRAGAADRARRDGALARRSGRSGSRTGSSSAPSPEWSS